MRNGFNFACMPLVEHMLSLHIEPVHYLSDDYLIYHGLTRKSAGFEPAAGLGIDLASKYKALVVDRANLDARIERVLEERLVDADGKVAFLGTAEYLRKDGLPVNLPKWRSAIFKVQPQ